MMTWWLPVADEAQPVLTTSFPSSEIRAVRVIWRDVGLDTPKGVKPGPFRYRVEAEPSAASERQSWIAARVRRTFLLIIASASRLRLVVLGHPEGIQPAETEFTVLGPVR
jgi:xylan 1,4-beta-xylosidase